MKKCYRVISAMPALALAVVLSFPAISAFATTPSSTRVPAVATGLSRGQGSGVSDKYVNVFGVKIHYLEAGSGPDVILLHGLGGDASNWASNIGPLSRKYHVVVPDQVGFGKSEKPFIPYRVGTLVDFLDQFMDILKISKASIVGNSLGGWTAAAFALAHPNKVDKLVLVDAAGFSLDKGVDPKVLYGLNPSTKEGMKQLMSLVVYNKEMFDNPATVDLLFTRKMAAGDGYTIQQFINSVINGEDVLDNTVSGIKQPTLIIWGKQDLLVPLATGERYHKSINGSELLVIDKCGHVPMLEHANEFNAALMKFLAGEQPEGLSQ